MNALPAFDPHDLKRLARGTPRQRAAHAALTGLGIFTLLADFSATLAGTLPLDCDLDDSDLDVICRAANLDAFGQWLRTCYGFQAGFQVERLDVRGVPSLVASFRHGGFRVEVFAQDAPVARQHAVQHLRTEALLLAHDPAAREAIRALKRQGLSTEAAFCAHFGITGDPYTALLDPDDWARRLAAGDGRRDGARPTVLSGVAPVAGQATGEAVSDARLSAGGAPPRGDAGGAATASTPASASRMSDTGEVVSPLAAPATLPARPSTATTGAPALEPASSGRHADAIGPAAGPTLRAPALHRVVLGDNLPLLRALPDGCVDLVYIDPPFNTGVTQRRITLRTERADDGERVGFGGRRYRGTHVGEHTYADAFDDYPAFLQPRLVEIYRVLAPHGTLYVHLDSREVHYVKVLLDSIFDRACFLNEIIWAYDYGGRTRRKWPPKHDNILVYVKDPRRYTFNADAVDRIPYMAPELVGAEKAARGKLPTDTWWHTIVPTAGKEKTGYPTQKPLGILRRVIIASSNPGDLVLDCFAGSGTTGAACLELGRRFLLVDDNPAALTVMRQRFAAVEGIEWS